MRILNAGDQELIGLEPQPDIVVSLATQAGFDCHLIEDDRRVILELQPTVKSKAILLFDAAHPANLGWFSRCQFYVNGLSGAVLRTPLTISNWRDGQGRPLQGLRINLSKELPRTFRLPGHDTVSEQVIYTILYNFLVALLQTGVAICGRGSVEPLAGPVQAEK